MAKGTFYFSHDYNARSDEKIKKLIMKHGLLGYGLFWAIVEDLYQNANALQMDYDLLAFEYRTQRDVVESVINDFDLFIIDGDKFGSKSVESRLLERDARSQKARQAAISRWEQSERNASALQVHQSSNAIKERKGKENKGKESKQKTRFLPPTLDEVKQYCSERKNAVDPQKWFNHYTANGWMVGKNKMKDWKAAVRTWESNSINNARPKEGKSQLLDLTGRW